MSRLSNVNAYAERATSETIRDVVDRRAGYPLEGSNDSIDSFITFSLGNTRLDEDARREVREQNDAFHIDNALSNELLDAIIDMPVGFRTKTTLRDLQGCPIGLLSYKLRTRALERGMPEIVGSLVLVGTFVRFKNRVDTLEPRPSFISSEIPYYPKAISKDVDYFYFTQIPIDRVELVWPFATETPSSAIQGTSFKGRANISLNDYMSDFTHSSEGSDMSFFVMGYGAYIFKRFRNFRSVGYGGENARFRTRVVRSAGLRQVLFREYEGSVLDGAYRFYIPSGSDGNCFEASLRWCYLCQTSGDYINNFNRIWKRIMLEGGDRCKIPASEYEERYRTNGYPTVQLRMIAFSFFWLSGFKVEMWYRKRKNEREGEWTNLLKIPSYVDEKRPVERECYGRIVLFQCEDSGFIRDDVRRCADEKASDLECDFYSSSIKNSEIGRMMHCIGITPPPACFGDESRSPTGRTIERKRIVEDINYQSNNHFSTLYQQKKYWEDIAESDIRELVDVQKRRYEEGCVNTLIFNPEKRDKKESASPISPVNDYASSKNAFWREKMWENNGKNPEYYVFAYDLETVTNVLSLHYSGSSSHKVYAPFRRDGNVLSTLSDYQLSIYDPVENQIPFSAQWIAVNVSDRGGYLVRKEEEFGVNNGAINTITTYTPDVTSEDKEFFLSEAFTEEGDGLLGKCVEDMLVNMANYVYARKGRTAICYAHNGAHFDAFVVLQFQRFEVVRILKTSRGVMTVSIRVPITMTESVHYDYREHDVDVPKVTITLRDTMLQVPGSLARLCKGFNVPQKYCKLDFPIQKVNASNYDHPAIKNLIRDYGENDVKALAVIIVRINDLIGSSPWRPANISSLKPPITQFVTCMGMIRESTRIHFKRVLPIFMHPQAIDVPALRNWLQVATIGGRVNAYAKTYTSAFAGAIMKAALEKDVDMLRELYKNMIETNQCTQVLDFTSLYPFAMDSCPMPTGRLHWITKEQCWEDIEAIGCSECDKNMSLCSIHRCTYAKEFGKDGEQDKSCVLRPFSVVIVKNVGYTQCNKKRNMCPRKSFLSTTQKPTSLAYTLESNKEYAKRRNGKEEIHDTQAFTNVDLYWMHRQGFVFEIVGGFGFEVTTMYNLFIGPAFQQRIKAKQEGNKLLSDFLKLNYNGSFGITTQQDIVDSFFTARIDDSLKDVDPRTPEVRKAVYEFKTTQQGSGLDATEELTGEAFYLPSGQALFQKRKKDHLSEFYSDQSPMQIGAAVLSWSRHIANLVMFNISEEEQLYTDTDSIQVSNRVTVENESLAKMICNRDDAPLGSLKNDHADNNGTEPRIFFSMIGTKKVKCHMTLNQEGKIRIFNTFKGLNVATSLENGINKHPEYAEYITAKTLLHLNKDSCSPPVTVTSWKRDLQHGVSITNHLQTLSPDTYLEDCKGTIVKNKDYGVVEFFIPHGCIVHPDFPVYKDESKGLECTQGPRRRNKLLSKIWVGIEHEDLVDAFIDDYYAGVDSEYNPGTEEYKKIMSAFELITE